MTKYIHEVRDPIHVFIRMTSEERAIVDSRPLQRLRHIHQLAMTFLVYPGATHKRFEHSLGVMELASRVYDVVTDRENIKDRSVGDKVPHPKDHKHSYWRQVLRVAALCHDIGHLPFSHAAEKELLPPGWTHERLTLDLIMSSEMKPLWARMKIEPKDVAKLAVGPREYSDDNFSDWEAILAEIITGDAFGVDRIDYLLRDSYHAGVAYGRFDHHRLIDCLRILPSDRDGSKEPALGVEFGGIHGAEALLLARYFMYTQLYFHPVRRIYDVHLKDFLAAWLKDGKFTTDPLKHLELTDNEVMAAILETARKPEMPGHDHARRIAERDHFKLLYSRNPQDIATNPDATRKVYEAACREFGEDEVRCDIIPARSKGYDFPVLTHDDRIESSISLSDSLERVPPASAEYVFVEAKLREKAKTWLEQNRENVIRPTEVV